MDTFPTRNHFSIHSNRHPEDEGSTFIRNVGKFNHYTIQKPKRRTILFTSLLILCSLNPTTDVLVVIYMHTKQNNIEALDLASSNGVIADPGSRAA
jgi:predicted AlkP superfamily pyrophosphatase or phosphodiesterase